MFSSMNSVLHVIFYTCIIIWLTRSAATTVKPNVNQWLDYGDECVPYSNPMDNMAESKICNPTLNLDCTSKVCRCNTQSIYDKNRRACLLQIGSTCKPPTDLCLANATCLSGKDTYSKIGPVNLLQVYYKLVDLPYDPDYYSCRCRKGFESSGLSKLSCRPLLEYGSTCNKSPKSGDFRCDYTGGQVCSTSDACVCKNPQLMRYNKDMQRCETPLGASCVYDGNSNQCGRHAICSTFLDVIDLAFEKSRASNGNTDQVGRPNANRREANSKILQSYGVCVCLPGYNQDSTGHCTASFEVACSTTADCNTGKFLSCIDGLCQCEKPTSQVFLQASGAACWTLSGYACSDTSGPKCVQHSVCVKGKCACGEGFSETADGRCLLGHGSECSATSDMNTTPCNNFQGLACTSSKCACFDSVLKWNATQLMCTAREGKLCGQFKIKRRFELEANTLYPFAFGNESDLWYAIGCEDGYVCAQSEIQRDSYHCRKIPTDR